MVAQRGRDLGPVGRVAPMRWSWAPVVQGALTASIVAATALIATFVVLALAAPRLSETLRPDGVQPDGEHAFMQGLSLRAPWPYVLPSHPDYILLSSDAALLQDGKPIGILETSHANIRRLGDGRYDLWQGTLWFSTTGPDPRDPSHVYTFSVASRLAPEVSAGRSWCAAVLLALFLAQIAWSTAPYVVHGGRRGAPPPPVAARMGLAAVAAWTWCWHLRWRFRMPFFLATLALLVGWTSLAWREPMPFIFEPDSRAYIEPGLGLLDGQSLAEASVRNLGYPLLAYVAVRLGSIADLVPLQFGIMVLALTYMSQVMARFFEMLLKDAGFARGRAPVVLTAAAGAASVLYCLTLFSHDAFVISTYRIMAEVPHFLAMAFALLCFAVGWSTPSRRNRILAVALATDSAFLSTVIKPSSLLAFGVCAASLAVACAMGWRELRSKLVLCALVLSVCFIGAVHRLDTWATPSGDDFAARALFCNHLDVVDRHVEPTTPERATIKELIARVFSLGPEGWYIQGYDGDECSYAPDFIAAIAAAARSEGRSVKDWELHEFETAILAHPMHYARHVAHQFYTFLRYPLPDPRMRGTSGVTDGDWAALVSYSAIKSMKREQFEETVLNWFDVRAPYLVDHLQHILRLMASTFAIVATASTGLALRNVLRDRRAADLGPEAVLLAVGGFTTALPTAIALAHSFDVARYVLGILPFALLWWSIGVMYILREALRAAVAVVRPRLGRLSTAGTPFGGRTAG